MSENQALSVDDHPIVREGLKKLLQNTFLPMLIRESYESYKRAVLRFLLLCLGCFQKTNTVFGRYAQEPSAMCLRRISAKVSKGIHMPKCFLRIVESLMVGFAGASSAAFLKDAVASSCFPILSSERARL